MDTALLQLANPEGSARLGQEVSETAEKSGAGPLLWVLGLVALIAIFGFLVKMRMDKD